MEWIKMDLHHHTGEDKDRKEKDFDYEKILKEFNEENVKLIAITNHNKISTNSIRKYKKIIEKNKYDIKILPGIEVEFTMSGNKNGRNKRGHVNLIFDNEYKVENLEKFFNNKDNYDSKNKKEFKEYFPELIMNIQNSGFRKFIIMPDFDKSNPVDYQTIVDNNLNPWIFSFDILEGKITNEKSIKRIKKSLEKSKYDSSQAIYTGTDSKTTLECISNINKISYVLSEASFKGIVKMVQFPKTRISKISKEKPYLLKNYISSIKIGNNELRLSVGLNTIIGRRGTGKSFLINSIIKKLKPEFNEKDNRYTKDIEIYGTYKLDKVIYFEQSKISDTLSDIVNNIAEEKQKDFNLIDHIYKGSHDRMNFINPIIDFINSQKKLKMILRNILNLNYEILKNNYKKNLNTYKNEIIRKFKKNIMIHMNNKEIIQIDKDIKNIQKIFSNDISVWTKFHLYTIINKLKLLKKNKKYSYNKVLTQILKTYAIENTEMVNSNKEKIFFDFDSYKDQLKEINIIKNQKKLYEIIDPIIKFEKNVRKGNEYSHRNMLVNKYSLDFLTFDNKIDKILNINEGNEFVWKFLGFAFDNKKMQKKKRIASNQQILSYFNISVISKINNEPIGKLSVGQRHEKFMENILKIKEAEIIILDQPDDDLDAITIQNNLIDRFTKHFNNKQWIVVTHDPKIVINSDSRNIIRADFDAARNNYKYYEVSDDDMKNKSFKVLDSKKEYPYIRGRKYQEGKW